MQKSLLQLIRINRRPQKKKNSSCFSNKTRVKGKRVPQSAIGPSKCIHKKFSFPISSKKKKNITKKQCRLKSKRINLAVTAANSGNKPRILTLVDKNKNRKKKRGGLAELNQATAEAEHLTENKV